VIALDLPGHGQSTRACRARRWPTWRPSSCTLSRRLEVDRVHLVGHSMGGAIAVRSRSTSRRAWRRSRSSTARPGSAPRSTPATSTALSPRQSRRELKPVVEQLFADPELVSRQLLDDLLKYKRLDGVSEAAARAGAAQFGGGRQAEQPGLGLAAGGAPLLVVWGREDRIIPAAHAANAPAGAAVEVLDGVGHMAMMEKASEVNKLLLRHLG
jgi:pyruvate dehydrogenase E2 component (dihydrolipoamide acetyltransferase)